MSMLCDQQEYPEHTVVHQYFLLDYAEFAADDPHMEFKAWLRSPAGQWCEQHALPGSLEVEMEYNLQDGGYDVTVHGRFREEDLAYYFSKWTTEG